MSFRCVYEYRDGLETEILAIVPAAVVIITPDYDGYSGIQYCEAIVTDADQPTLSSNNPAGPVLSGPTPDGAGSLITRRLQSTQIDQIAPVLAQVQTARAAAAGDAATKNAALDAADDLLTNLLSDVAQRPVDPGY